MEHHWTWRHKAIQENNAQFFMSHKVAELIGIFLGDGSISIVHSEKYSTYYCAKITLDSREILYRNYVSRLMKDVLGVAPIVSKIKGQNTINISIFRKHIIGKLLVLGLRKSPKWKRAIVPEQFMTYELGKHVLRGYFDTDGCVVIANNNGTRYPRLEMKISPSPMQVQLISLLKMYGFTFGVYDIGRGKVRIQMNGLRPLQKWTDIVGFSNEKHGAKAESFLENGTFNNSSASRQNMPRSHSLVLRRVV